MAERLRTSFWERPDGDYARDMPKRWVFGENGDGFSTVLVKSTGINIASRDRYGNTVDIVIPWEEMDRMQVYVREDL